MVESSQGLIPQAEFSEKAKEFSERFQAHMQNSPATEQPAQSAPARQATDTELGSVAARPKTLEEELSRLKDDMPHTYALLKRLSEIVPKFFP